jgi:hypothetical protein
MIFLSYFNRFISNFVLLTLVYYSLNALEKYQQRAILALLVLIYVLMRAISAWRSFSFFQCIERLEQEAKRLGSMLAPRPGQSAARAKVISDVAEARRHGELKSYVDLMFLGLIVMLCVAKIVTE